MILERLSEITQPWFAQTQDLEIFDKMLEPVGSIDVYQQALLGFYQFCQIAEREAALFAGSPLLGSFQFEQMRNTPMLRKDLLVLMKSEPPRFFRTLRYYHLKSETHALGACYIVEQTSCNLDMLLKVMQEARGMKNVPSYFTSHYLDYKNQHLHTIGSMLHDLHHSKEKERQMLDGALKTAKLYAEVTCTMAEQPLVR